MKLLVITQAVDTNDQALGFFHRWLEVFAGKFERIEVVCLKEGAHSLPANVQVHSLGKEKKSSRLKYLFNFYRYVFSLQYDAVFVHMNEEYILLGAWWWRISGKKVVLWRNHKMGSWRTRVAVRLATIVCYTSPDAFVAQYKNAVRMPIGIDTDFFTPAPAPPPNGSILFLGRLDPVKRAEVFIEALANVPPPFKADIYGSPTQPDSTYTKMVAALAEPLVKKGALTLQPGVLYEKVRGLYRTHLLYVNLTPSGSFDKTIGEAIACGCIVICANGALRGVLPNWAIVESAADAAAAMGRALALPSEERERQVHADREYIEREHSLRLLVDKLSALFV